MGRKIRKIGGHPRKSKRTVRIVRKAGLTPSAPIIEFQISEGYQGIRRIKELVSDSKITVNKRIYEKLNSKSPGHLSILEIKKVLESPDEIYLSNKDNREVWFITSKLNVKRTIVKIEKHSDTHRLATAHLMSISDFQKLKKNLTLIWFQ